MAPILEFLGQLADSLSTSTESVAGGRLIHVTSTAGGQAVGILDLEGAAPAEFLLGTVAPDEWQALGVACTGWAHPLDPQPGESRKSRRMVGATIVHRSGAVVSRMRVGSEVVTEPPAYGLTLDGLQRALNLPTAPPLVPTGDLFARMWLADVAVAARDHSGGLTWAQARRLHPAVVMLGEEEAMGASGDLVPAAAAVARVFDWERLRWLSVEGRWWGSVLTPAEAAWCDAGAFSRWVLDGVPTVDALLDRVKAAAGPGIGRRCTAALRRLGVLGRRAA